MPITRRRFLTHAAAASAAFSGLAAFFGSGPARAQAYVNAYDVFGALEPDPKGIIDLPQGFTYRVLSPTGALMSDGLRVPARHDGMAAFPGRRGRVILVRNHELSIDRPGASAFGEANELASTVDRTRVYDAGAEGGKFAPGGTTTLVYNPESGEVEQSFLSLAGTAINCAGGAMSWGSWLSCEETEAKAGERGYVRDHGYVFEVPAHQTGLVDPVPLAALGRFTHEAIAEDPRTGVLYLSEDKNDGLLYRFVPRARGRLAEGGRLQALKVAGQSASLDTRNWLQGDSRPLPVRIELTAEWIDLDRIDAPDNDLRLRGAKAGAAIFARGEGMWFGNGNVYFAATSGGPKKLGQIFRYRPSPFEGTILEREVPAKLVLDIESVDPGLLEKPDNLTVAPWGHLIICEDGDDEQYIRGVTEAGELYTIARNAHPMKAEFCGACFGPDLRTLFVNIQTPGITLAIAGPWARALRA